MNIIKFNNSILKYDGKWLETYARPDYNPLNLPPNTFRVRTSDGNMPDNRYTTWETATLVSGTSDVYDVYKSGTDLTKMFSYSMNVVEVLGANTSNITSMNSMFQGCRNLTAVPLFDTSSVTDMRQMFQYCNSLTSVPLFDTSKVTDMYRTFEECETITTIPLFNTSNVTNMGYMFDVCTSLITVPLFDTSKVTFTEMMFNNCTSLTTIPLFNTSNVTDMDAMFYWCLNVEHGAFALYQQASSQANPPTNHNQTFFKCGSDTTTGRGELFRIPSDWK